MTKDINKLKGYWYDFGLSYLNLAELGCREIIEKKYNDYKITDLYIAIIYNIKHGIEVFLKTFIVFLQEKELSNRNKHHDQLEVFDSFIQLMREKEIKKIIKEKVIEHKNDEQWIFTSRKAEEIEEKIEGVKNLVFKYYQCLFLSGKINDDYIIEDSDNTAFRYPQNNLKILLNYREILDRIELIDIHKVYSDVLDLQNAFLTLYLICSACEKEQDILIDK